MGSLYRVHLRSCLEEGKRSLIFHNLSKYTDRPYRSQIIYLASLDNFNLKYLYNVINLESKPRKFRHRSYARLQQSSSKLLLRELENPLLYRLKVKQFPLISLRLYYAVTFECAEKKRSARRGSESFPLFRWPYPQFRCAVKGGGRLPRIYRKVLQIALISKYSWQALVYGMRFIPRCSAVKLVYLL